MRVIHGKMGSKKNLGKNLSIAIGNFDGVHLGHQKLINEAKKYGDVSAVFTFNPHPSCITRTNFNYYFLTPLSRKIELIRALNPDFLFIIDFDQKGASFSKNDFITWLHELHVSDIICGNDWRFGYKKEGRITDLESEFNVHIINSIIVDDKKISSTYVKELLKEGNIKKANNILGREYFIEGKVVHGNNLGRTIGFKTANIDIFGNVAPKNGVYAVKVIYNNKQYLGMCNIGFNPTFNKQKLLRLETHIIDFDKEIYGEDIIIYFFDFIREEKTFSSKEELSEQLRKDKEYIKNNYKIKNK